MSRNPEQYPLVELRGMQFFAYHGCHEQERKVGNRFLVELKMRAEESQALVSDDISDALNYAQAYQVVAREMAVPSHLLEHVANRILTALFASFPQLRWASITVEKLNPPLGGNVYSSAVTLERERGESAE